MVAILSRVRWVNASRPKDLFLGDTNLAPPIHFAQNIYIKYLDIDGLVQDCSNSSANALELLQSCIKPLIYISVDELWMKSI